MIINNSRGVKIEKDREAIKNLFPHIDVTHFYAIFDSLSKKEKNNVADFMEKNQLSFRSP